jgi:RNA polymerase sigma-70 factor (ECF subfamily)
VSDAPTTLIEDVFRRESGHLVSALTRLLGPANLALAEDVVHDALLRALQAWQSGLPDNPKAWLLQTAKNRAIDMIRRDRRFVTRTSDEDDDGLEHTLDVALSPAEDTTSQLAMMFSICDESLSRETHVTLILRLLCGLSPAEIGRAFLADTATIDRRLHRGRARLQELGRLHEPTEQEARTRLSSVIHALYLLFNEGYHGSDSQSPLHPAMCADALRLAELVLESPAIASVEVHALAALFCFHSARLSTRLDSDRVLVPLADQDRTHWDQTLIGRGLVHLGKASTGDRMTRWHLEAGVACEHTIAPSVADTNWQRIVELYDALLAMVPSPIVALNRGVAIAELHGLDAGRDALLVVGRDAKVSEYPFFWGALADIERRAGRVAEARGHYERAIALARNRAERVSYEKKLQLLTR